MSLENEIKSDDKPVVDDLVKEFYLDWRKSVKERAIQQCSISVFEDSQRIMSQNMSYDNRQLCEFAFRSLVSSFGFDLVSISNMAIEKRKNMKVDSFGFILSKHGE